MTVARAAQDEVEEVKKEMQEKVKAAQEASNTQVERERDSDGERVSVGPGVTAASQRDTYCSKNGNA